MKKHLLFNQSFGTEGSPNQTGETLTRENRGLMSYLRRTLMLLFAVLVMSIANIGTAWGETLSVSITSPNNNSITDNNITVTHSSRQSKTFNGVASTTVYKVDGSNPISITSTTQNITKLVFEACYSNSGTSLAKSCKVTVSEDGSTYYPLTSIVNVSGGTGTTATSTSGIYISGYSGKTEVTVTFHSAYRYIKIEKDGQETWVNVVKVYTESNQTITWNNGGHSTAPTSPTSAAGLVMPRLHTTEYVHVGWKANATTRVNGVATDANILIPIGAAIQLTAATTLTAQWEEADCTGLIFSMFMHAVATKKSLTGHETIDISNYADISKGAEVFLTNTSSSAYGEITNSSNGYSGYVSFKNNAVYLKLDLCCPLQTNDVLSFTTGSGDNQVYITSSTTRSSTYVSTSNSWTVPAAFNGVSTIYIWAGSNTSANIRTLAIIRPGSSPSTSPDDAGTSGTITFEDWKSLSTATNYWKDGIKFYQYSGTTGVSLSHDYFLIATTVPSYYAGLRSGKNWGSYNLSGLVTFAHHALGISVTSPSQIEIILSNNKKDDANLTTLFIKKDNVDYKTGYAGGTYAGGTDIKSDASITCLESGNGRYKITLDVDAADLASSNPYIVKLGASGSSAPALFCYESVTVTPIVSCTDPGVATSLTSTAATGTSLTLGWTAGSNASSYKVSLFTDADCTVEASSTEGNDYAVNTNSVTYTGLSLNSTYYFKVQSVGDGSSYCEDGPWSSASGAVKTGVCNDYSFHYGTENADDWTTTCFTQVGATSEWEVTDFTIPSKPNWYVGKYGFFYNDGMNYENAKSHTDAWSDLFFAASQGNGSGTRPKVGAATGATGRIRIYNNSSWNNLFASFEPDGYKLKFGSSTYDTFEADGSVDHCYWSSSLYTYSSSNAGDLVSVGIIDANNDFVSTNNTEGMKHIFLNTGGTDYWSKDNITNFGLWNETGKSWTCLMTKVPGEDYLYEGWVPSTCTQVIFARLKSSDLKWKNNDSDGSNTNVYDQTGTWTIPANTNMFTISSWSSGSWSAYTKSGKFRMWDNSTDKNWYVHFYPHNVLSYDGNGGSGSMTPQSVKADADSKTVTVAANGFTRSGWEFTGWNTAEDGSGTAYEVGADFDLTSDQTLYAQWEKTIYLQSDLEWWYDADESSNSAWFSVYYWKSGQTGAWVTMEIAEECSDPAVYKATLPGNGFTNLIFVRKTATKTTGWEAGVNNQSVDIDYPTTYNKFTIAGTDNGKVTGTWGTYSVPTFTISYNKGTNGTGTKDNESKTCSVDFTLPGGTFTYDGHSQDGWATSDGGTKAYNLSGSYTTNVAQTFYPHWKCNTPEISCSSGTVTITVPSGATVYYTTTTDGSEPADPTSSSSEYDPESKPTISEDTKIKAIAIQDGCTSSEIASEDLEYVNTYTVTYTTTESTSGSAPTDSNSPYTSGSTVTVLGNTGSLVKTDNVFLGWSDGSGNNYAPGETFTISSNTTLSPIWKDGTSATVTYTMAVGNKAWSASGSSNETTGIPNAGVTITDTNAGIDGNGTGSDDKARTSKLAIKTGANGATYDSPTNYILYNFSVASGYAFTPSNITIKIANVGSSSANNIKYKAVLSDESSHSISTTYICTTGDGTIETFHLYNEEGVAFDGNVSLKLWAWTIENISSGGSNYRLGTPLTIAGVTESTCSTPADPDGLAVGSITSSGATFTITDDESPASYEIYYSTSSTAPTSGTAASATTTSKTKAVTGLDPSTTYYAWVRAVCNASYKSDWVALTGSSFETEVMSIPATLDKSNVTAVSDDTYWSDDNTYYDYGSTDATNTSRYQDWEVNVIPCTYEVSVVMNTSGDGDGTQWGLQLLDAEEKVIASYNSVKAFGETSKTYDAKWDLTKINEGVYTLRVKNIFSFAQPKLKSLTLDASIYTITYDANGGTCGTESEMVCGGGVTLPIPTKAGYACIGWYNSSDVKQGDAGGDYEPDNDITLYAHWAAMPTVSDLEIDYPNATATSIPLSWTIPGKIDLSTASFDDSDPDYFISSQKPANSKSYDSSSEELTVTYTATQWAQKGVALPFAETNLESVTYEYKGHRVFPAVVKSDGSTLYWDYDIVTTADDWTKVTRTPSRIYSNAGTVSPLPTAKAITFCANPNEDKTDESFYIRNVFYHLQGQADVDHVVLMRKEGSAATDTTDASATKLYSGKKSHFTDNTAVAGKAYYYTVFTVHASGVVSTGVSEHLTIYTITYDKGANGAGTIADGKKTGQIDFTLTGTRFTRDHYIQDGWSELDGGAKVYEMSGTYSTDDDITLYPHWVNLDLHQPGVYEKPESLGGYGRPLKNISSHDYEVYFMTQDTVDETNHGALYAGPKEKKISLGKEIFKEAAANTEIKGDGWMAFNMASSRGGSSSARIGSAASGSEFFIADGDNSDGAKDSRYAEILSGNYIRFRVSGYDQFSFYGGDYNASDQFIVKIDGITQSYTHNYSNNRNIFRFDISTGEHLIEITANGTGEHYCKFRGFSLRLPDVTRYTVSAESNNDSYGAVSASSVTNVRSGSTLYVSSNTFTVNGTTITATPESNTAEYSYAFNNWTIDSSPVTTTATISAATTVTATFTATANQYSVTHTLSNVTTSSGSTGSNAATYGTDYTAVFAASSGYALPNSVTVTAGGSDITASCTYTKATGTVLVPGASITGNIVITVTGVATFDFRMIADADAESELNLANDEAIEAGKKNCTTISGGTAVYSGSGMKVQKGTTYGWYFGSNSDIITITLSGKVLQTGSTITIYAHSAADKGFAINGVTTVNNTTGETGAFNGTYTVQSTDADLINKNVLAITRVGSSAIRMYSITISNCATGTPCVTPVLPSLTTPNSGCTTGDFAEWDASVTNSAAISAASGDQEVTYSWTNSSSVEVGTDATFTPTSAGTYTVTATVHSETSGYIDATATSSTLTASLYGNPSVTGPSDANYVVGASASNLSVTATPTHGESLTYQWYSNTAKSTSSPTPTALENCTTSTYKPSTAAAGTTYYFCKVSGGCEDVYSSIATVAVSEAPCFTFSCESQSSSISAVSAGGSITAAMWDEATLTGGSMTNSAASQGLNVNRTYGLVFDSDNNEVTVTLSGDNVLAKDAVITLSCYSLNDDSKSYGFKINGNNMSPATYTPTADSYETFTQSYTIPTASALIGKKSFKITRYNSNKVYLNGITVTGCDECEGITPSLSYSKTTLWVNDGDTSTPTLDKDESTGSVTYSSSNTDVATVNESTGVVTAVAGGNVTITASIAADGTHCANTATCNLTIKQATCGEVVIAGVTLSAKDAGTPEGTLIASSSGYVVSCQKWETPDGGCGTGAKLGESGNYICLTLKSGESFKNGDKVILDIATVPDVGDSKLHIYAGTSSAGTQLGENASPVCGENEIILSGISSSTPSITLYRTSGDDKQNPYVVSMKVKRFICTDCLGFVDATENGNWNTAGNWIGSTGVSASVPTISDRVHIYKPVTVDINNAKASNVYIYTNSSNTGKVTIDAGNALIIAGKLAKSTNGTSYTTTAAADVIINSTRAAGTGALIIGGETGTNAATVNFETKVKRESGTGNWINQFIGSPFSDLKPYVDYALQIYAFKADGSGNRGYWNSLSEGDEMEEFVGHNILYNDNDYLDVQWTGTLNASSDEKTLTGYYGSNTYSLFANSWVAPIHIGSFESTDFANMDATIYIFNAGTPQQEKEMGDGDGAKTDAGTYAVIPISSGEWIEGTLEVIPAMQAFFVNANAASPSLTLDYSKLVYTPALTSVGITPTRAPRRSTEEEAPEVIRLRVAGENGWAETTYLLGREDFTEGFDNGWDGRYMEGEDTNPQLYAPTSDGNMAVNCVPQIEGTVLGFRKGNADSQYTFSFEYAGEEEYYLKDLKLDIETRIDNESTYAFTAEAGDNAARFIIVRKTPAVATGVDNVDGDGAKVRKLIINDKVYIIRGGRIYSVDGALVK